MKSKLEVQFEIEAPLSEVWDAFTNSEKTKYYMFGTTAKTDWNQGSELLWVADHEGKEIVFVQGHIVKIQHESYLEYTIIAPNMDIRPENHLHTGITLQPSDNATKVVIEAWDFEKVDDGEKRYADAEMGWKMVIEKLKEMLE